MRTKKGIVTSAKMEKTIVVTVHQYKVHSKYKKRFRTSSKFVAHDPEESCHEGDEVIISESRPLSKRKRWVLTEILKRAPEVIAEDLAQVAPEDVLEEIVS
ncbi:30S ribosomal protein S17 [Candidatus Peregrinibacteria bacterium]|nr:30S ribosomal protein S17 [Candidatus Peregrinibacteria bacterium]